VVDSAYRVEFRPEALRDLSGMDPPIVEFIFGRIRWLSEHFDDIMPEPLKGKAWRGVYKFRAGDYRALYAVNRDRRLLTVHAVGHRRDIYRTE